MAMSVSHLRDAIKAELVGKSWVADNAALTEFCTALATAIVAEVQAARITISPANAGLQTSTPNGTPTAGPAAPVTVDGALS